ncbi:hypothetical protein [Hymenobacter weizhouensis]|uniref:hypothetical protein n=1 Tax=Hymenobacter sp. YIM 151500-1 TaxID=2987689 RepID=UPI002226E153|nr:hypothetical protein [Hymenobacter sp. YIM 151500-1]UYZ63059.1 hypothetical protein OIS53_18950 [Hymenobacter sp. YIM 151500-1]
MKLSYFSLSIATVCFLSACGKDDSPPTVLLSGEVRLMDEFGRAVADRSGIKVSSATGSTETNQSGYYEVKAQAGSQTIMFEKAFLGTYKLLDHPVKKAEKLPTVTVGTRNLRGVQSIVVSLGNDAVYIRGLMGDITPIGLPPRKHRLFFNNGPVSSTSYSLTTVGETNVSDDQFFDVITFDQLRSAGLLPGTPLQVTAYGDNIYADTYTDPVSKKVVYPALSTSGSNFASFTY